ncbi:DNA replication and repair protein RecO [Orenia marismortui]|uniref:DNA repair protein RecO n=2 Tax=Orenia marismortui TaxID=46469 RepID=A0A4R8GXY3_9FIRM|nr:DNA replication and repair protein RecO [Orenia marismortui]
MPLFDTDAIVLRNYEFDEADKIVSLFSKEKGKIKVVAKGVRKTKSTLAAGLQPFVYNNILVYQGKSELGKLSQCEIKEPFNKIRGDIYKMAYASYIVELIDELTIDKEDNQLVFSLLLLTLRLVDRLDDLELITRVFELKLLKLLGYEPYLNSCVECGKELGNNIRFDGEVGGTVCSCSAKWAKKISLGTIKYMKQILRLDYKKLLEMKIPQYARNELFDIMPYYIQYLIHKKLKSISFIESLKDMS